MTDTKSLFRYLNENRFSPDEIPDLPEPGVYAIFAAQSVCLPRIVLPPSALVYIGLSHNLAERNHFSAAHSGFSSPRRSLGALLKSALRLNAEPRSLGRSRTNYKNYRFAGYGEERLTAWMRRNLTNAVYPNNGNTNTLEKRLIKENAPPLNLTLWRNPQKAQIQDLRKVCELEAKRIHLKRHPQLERQ